MSKRVYISADYDEDNGDRDVVDVLHSWGTDNKHKVDFVDTAEVISGSVSKNEDCRICDLKSEFNSQINVSSAVIFVIGDKTKSRTAGCECNRMNDEQDKNECTPYKHNSSGKKDCKVVSVYNTKNEKGVDCGNINSYSYLKHEFVQATRKKESENIIIIYNSLQEQESWLPSYMEDYKDNAHPFWTKNANGDKVGDYTYIKKALGYE